MRPSQNAQAKNAERANIDNVAHYEHYFALKQEHSVAGNNFWQFFTDDVQTIYQRDPAARNWLEVLVCYPWLHALWCHRVAHLLHSLGIPFVPRFLSFLNRLVTGIEIHPGAKIGKGVFIDHGMGVVIGETAVVGDYALIYQGATLGGTGKEKGKRHPTLGNHVVVGAGAKVLGNIQIGDNVRIGAGSVVLRDVPSNSTVVGVPGRVTRLNGQRANALEHNKIPDVEAEVISLLFERVKELEKQIFHLQAEFNLSTVAVNQEKMEQDKISSDGVIQDFLDGAGI
ncbi:MAG TPA: serine O-acetyltransferase [Oscillatoriaceae cyanobacterium M33_DOE_052]|uniref:Serine acetyltransferase n=1 Tax=Planktothricoides sp. SpSt-374 TaxID=2282167 RepID=A0A7C3ZI30_9CYAN|nr:serine O-acetyltransferase [Oscillatoriaceae cyanobacterium M33_DOE_052]